MEKRSAIPEMQKVMKTLDCRGCVVTADAMNTQKATAQAIIEDAHGDYCLALKGNQKTACQEVKEYFSCEELLKEVQEKEGCYKKETEETSIETITREYYITDDIKWFADRKEWKKLTSIGYERKTVAKKGTEETRIEERYYLCSIKPIAELICHVYNKTVEILLPQKHETNPKYDRKKTGKGDTSNPCCSESIIR